MDLPFGKPLTPEEQASKDRAAASKKAAEEAREKAKQDDRARKERQKEVDRQFKENLATQKAKAKAQAKADAAEERASYGGGLSSRFAGIRNIAVWNRNRKAVNDIKKDNKIYDPETKTFRPMTTSEQLDKLELERQLKEKKNAGKLFDTDALKTNIKRHGAVLAIFVLLMLPVGIFLYLGYTGHTGLFSYQEEAFYGPFFSSISSFISPIFSLVSNELTCVANPTACISPNPSHQVNNTASTFTSFISVTPAQSIQVAYVVHDWTSGSTPPSSSGQLFYSVKNTANVPLGTDTPNDVVMNISCGSSNDQAATVDCQGTTPNSQDPVISPNSPTQLINSLFESQTIENQTTLAVSCPTEALVSIANGGSIASLQMNFTIENYSAASYTPIEFVDSNFDSLIAQSSPLIPSEPSVSFVSPGPVQISLSTSEPQPIITNTGDTPISITISNCPTCSAGTFTVSQFLLFIPMSLWPSNPQSGSWTCSIAQGGRKMNFVFPNGDYWECQITPANQIQGGAEFILPQVTTLSGSHFDTVPILAYATYNYIQSADLPYVVRAGSGISCSQSP